MKIAMLRPSYKPEISAGNHLASDLIQDLQNCGHEVILITPFIGKNGAINKYYKDDCKTIRISSKYSGNSVLKRSIRYIDTSIKLYKQLMNINNCNIILSHSMPPLLGPLCVRASRKKSTPVVFWEQDIISESILSTRITKNKWKQKIFYNVAKRLETLTEKGSTHIVTISDKFFQRHINEGINPEKISLIYNWIDTEEIYPVNRSDNPLFEKFGLDKTKFYVTYCGNLGVPQNVEIMIDAAKKLEPYKNIQFLIIGGGSREKIIYEYVNKVNPSNLKTFPLQPLEMSKYVYSIGNIGLVIGKSGTSNNGFPSKTLSIMAAGSYLISCFDIDSELSEFVKKSGGASLEPDNAELLTDAILDVYKKNMCGIVTTENRQYAQENFSRHAATKKFIDVITKTADIGIN